MPKRVAAEAVRMASAPPAVPNIAPSLDPEKGTTVVDSFSREIPEMEKDAKTVFFHQPGLHTVNIDIKKAGLCSFSRRV